jgi:hypothetical protein
MKQSMMILLMLLFATEQIFSQQRIKTSLVMKETPERQAYSIDEGLGTSAGSKKSVFLAVVASLLVPGMGELYAGSFESGKYHLIAEGGLWLAYGGFRRYSDWVGQDARTFANQNAQADFNNKDDQYAVNIGNFNTTEEYNAAKSRNREYDLMYQSPEYVWDWGGSDANRLRFRELRIRSDEVKNNAKFVIAAVVVNHLLSAFTAGRKAAAYNRALSSHDDIRFNMYTFNAGQQIHGLGVTFTAPF